MIPLVDQEILRQRRTLAFVEYCQLGSHNTYLIVISYLDVRGVMYSNALYRGAPRCLEVDMGRRTIRQRHARSCRGTATP
jgi:hypothetical protein